jgi:hypothetical protein
MTPAVRPAAGQPDQAVSLIAPDGPARAGTPGAAPAAMLLSARYGRAFDIAVVVVAASWHVAGAGSELIPDRARYGSLPAQCAAWVALALIIAVSSARLLRGRPSPRLAWALAILVLAIATAAAAGCPAGALLKTDWAWGTAGWTGVLLLLRRPLAQTAGFLAAVAAATLAVQAADGLSQATVAAFITTVAGNSAIQLVAAAAGRRLAVTAQEAARATQAEAADRERAVIAARLHAGRQDRWRAVPDTAGPLLGGLAAGTADPANPEVRRACAVEAARLRRLMAESDDAPGPLVHELHACADAAQRRGVAVDIETAGILPAVPAAARRVITDTAIAVLAGASSLARVTVTALQAGIAVSLVADAPGPALPAAAAGVAIDLQQDQHSVWVEARWTEW